MKAYVYGVKFCLGLITSLIALYAFTIKVPDRSAITSRGEFTQHSNALGMQSRSIGFAAVPQMILGGEASDATTDIPNDTAIDLTEVQPAMRPDWVDAPPVMTGDVHRWAVVSTPASSAELSRKGLDAQLRAVAETYIETLVDDPDAISVISIDDAWIGTHVSVDRQYEGKVLVDGEEMYESAAELLFEPADREWILSKWKSHLVGQRLVGAGILVAIIGTFLFAATAMVSMIVRRAEQRVTHGLPS
jgi:hypothetical protein